MQSMRKREMRAVGLALVAALVASPATGTNKGERYGIEGRFVAYDEAKQVFKVLVISREASGFGGSTVGGKAPDDVKPQAEMEFAVKPEGSVLSRTVIKSAKGTGLDKTGTQEGFRQAVQAIPTDRALALSIAPNPAAKSDPAAPRYTLLTVIIKLTEAEIQARLRELLQDEEGATPPEATQ